MALSGWDTEKAVKAQFGKHARVVNIDAPSRSQMRSEKNNKRHMSEEMKRSTDEIMGGAKTTDRLRAFSGGVDRVFDGSVDGDEYESVDARDNNGKRLVCRVCESKNGDHREVRWLAKHVGGYDMKTPRGWRSDSAPFMKVTRKRPAKEEIPPYPKMRVPVGTHKANGTVVRGKRRVHGGTRRTLGGMELANEDLGTNIEAHGDPSMVADFQKRGLLRKRLDAAGFPVTNLVCGSRKQQEAVHKEFNRRQKEAQSRGWQGTRSASGLKVHFLNHGGNTPGD